MASRYSSKQTLLVLSLTLHSPFALAIHVVAEGEVLSLIAQKKIGFPIYGPGGSLEKLIKLNPQVPTRDLIFPGDTIVVKLVESPKTEPGPEPGPEKPSDNEEDALGRPKTSLYKEGDVKYFVHLGSGALLINFSDTLKNPQVPIRIGFGAQHNRIKSELFYRQLLIQLSDEVTSSPRWAHLSLGYEFYFNLEAKRRATISPVLGLEYYSNAGVDASQNFNYLKKANSFSTGFSSQFPILERWTIGGLLLAGMINSKSYRVLIQGDLIYSLNQRWTLGGGYWFDYYNAQVRTDLRSTEKKFALEAFTRFHF